MDWGKYLIWSTWRVLHVRIPKSNHHFIILFRNPCTSWVHHPVIVYCGIGLDWNLFSSRRAIIISFLVLRTYVEYSMKLWANNIAKKIELGWSEDDKKLGLCFVGYSLSCLTWLRIFSCSAIKVLIDHWETHSARLRLEIINFSSATQSFFFSHFTKTLFCTFDLSPNPRRQPSHPTPHHGTNNHLSPALSHTMLSQHQSITTMPLEWYYLLNWLTNGHSQEYIRTKLPDTDCFSPFHELFLFFRIKWRQI